MLVVSGPAGGYCYQYDHYPGRILNLPGPDPLALGSLRVADGDVTACMRHCDLDPACRMFNYMRDDRDCWFKGARYQDHPERWYESSKEAYQKSEESELPVLSYVVMSTLLFHAFLPASDIGH